MFALQLQTLCPTIMIARLLQILIFAVAVAFGCNADAQMYKCIGENGKTSYRDRPCDSESKQTHVEGRITGRVPAIQYYELYSKDWQGMRAELNRKQIKGFHGLATWKVSYNYRWNRAVDGQCTISSVTPSFEGEIRIPRWVPGEGVAAAQRREWERYFAALKVHEEGHIANGRRLASALAQLSGLRVDCGAVDSTVRQRYDVLLQQSIAADAEYDKSTDHGTTQGAVLR